MALAYYDADLEAAPLYRPSVSLGEYESAHVRTYRKFLTFARIGAFCAPALLAFALYWTT